MILLTSDRIALMQVAATLTIASRIKVSLTTMPSQTQLEKEFKSNWKFVKSEFKDEMPDRH